MEVVWTCWCTWSSFLLASASTACALSALPACLRQVEVIEEEDEDTADEEEEEKEDDEKKDGFVAEDGNVFIEGTT